MSAPNNTTQTEAPVQKGQLIKQFLRKHRVTLISTGALTAGAFIAGRVSAIKQFVPVEDPQTEEDNE